MATGTSSNENMPLSIAIRHQLKLCYHDRYSPKLIGDVLLGPTDNTTFTKEILNLSGFTPEKVQKRFQRIEILEKPFSQGTVFVAEITDSGPTFTILKNIFLIDEKIYFHAEIFQTCYFDNFYHAYNVITDINMSEKMIDLNYLPRLPPCILVQLKESDLVVCRYDLYNKYNVIILKTSHINIIEINKNIFPLFFPHILF